MSEFNSLFFIFSGVSPILRMIYQFFIVNKSGGLIYNFERYEKTPINELMVLTSSLYSISTMLNTIACDVTKLDFTQIFRFKGKTITFYKIPSGASFIFVAKEPALKWIPGVLKMYSDFVMKDPFYGTEMPIRNPDFRPEILLEDIF